MKKNIKFIGAAAAALLAVAPVVASTATANAAVTVNNATVTETPATNANALTVNVSLNASVNSTVSDVLKTVKFSVDGATVNAPAKDVEIVNASTGKALEGTDKLNATTQYAVKAGSFTITGLTTGKEYTVAGGKIGSNAATKTYSAADLSTNSDAFTSASFGLTDSSLTGTPYFVQDNTVVSSSTVTVDTGSTSTVKVSDVVSAIEAQNFVAKVTDGGNAVINDQPDVTKAVDSALTAAGITVKDGSFTVPASNVFTVNLTATANNGKSATLPVTVAFNTKAVSAAEKDTYPVISYNGNKYIGANQAVTLASNASFNNVKVGGNVDTTAIKDAFTAVVSTNNDSTKLNVSVDTSKVNTAVAGTYPVTVSATNPSGKTSSVVFNLTVGEAGATYKTVAQEGNVYTVNGNNATQTTDTVSANQSIATFGTVTIGGVSYTRINSANSNKFVPTSVFTAEQTTSKTIMHVAQYYNKKGEKTTLNGKSTVGAYNEVQVVSEPVTINGSKYYKIAGQDAYVKAGNIDGTSRKLTHNAYIYNNKAKRVQKNTVLKKGTSKTTYGSSFKINGKAYYRIGKNQYVKVANFK